MNPQSLDPSTDVIVLRVLHHLCYFLLDFTDILVYCTSLNTDKSELRRVTVTDPHCGYS